jgi:cytochrome P450
MMLNSSKAPLILSNPGFPHWAMKGDVYDGYRILKGATVIGNIFFFIARDEDIYPDPVEFRPERFLGPSPQVDPHKFVFGFGRRACPGACSLASHCRTSRS